MYQGKFLPENRGERVRQLRENTTPNKPQKTRKQAPEMVKPVPAAQEQPAILEEVRPAAPERKRPVPPEKKQPAETETWPVWEEPEKVPAPAAEKKAPKAKKKKGIRVGTIIFYFLYLLLIGAAAYGIHYALGLLNDWLVVYEASQPDTRSQEIFNELFAEPDWGKIYDMAGLEGTEFEGKEAYITYMEQLVGDQELTYSKTSAGLSGGEKYIVRAGDEKVATFTMENPITDELEIPQWDLSGVEAGFFTRDEDVTILTQPGRTVKLNGVTLGEEYIIKTTSSTVDEYLYIF